MDYKTGLIMIHETPGKTFLLLIGSTLSGIDGIFIAIPPKYVHAKFFINDL